MATDAGTERVLASVTARLNDQHLDEWDPKRVQEIVTEALGGERDLKVDDGGGLHDESGTRIGAIRRTPSGEWITDRQNETAERSEAEIPASGPQSKFRQVLAKLKLTG